jgi:putative ABC transport system ATP-binding protein
MSQPLIEMQELSKTYLMGDTKVHALRGVSLSIASGEFVAIMGPSGSGKSTLMNMLGCLDRPDQGVWRLNGEEIGRLSDDQLATIRNHTVGFIFQNFNLLSRSSALKNVELPLLYRGLKQEQRRQLASEALNRVGLADRLHHKPKELSGGQQQRVAIARALVGDPKIILADEPTGNLDSRSGLEIMSILQDLNQQGRTLIMVTHDPAIGEQCHRIIRLLDGRVVSDQNNPHPVSAKECLAKLPPPDEEVVQ